MQSRPQRIFLSLVESSSSDPSTLVGYRHAQAEQTRGMDGIPKEEGITYVVGCRGGNTDVPISPRHWLRAIASSGSSIERGIIGLVLNGRC